MKKVTKQSGRVKSRILLSFYNVIVLLIIIRSVLKCVRLSLLHIFDNYMLQVHKIIFLYPRIFRSWAYEICNATTRQRVAKILQKYSPPWESERSFDTVFINGNVTGNHYGSVKTCQIVACAQLWYFLVNCFSSLPYLTGTNKAPIGDFYDLQLLTSPRFILSPVGNLATIFMIPGG